MLMLLLLLPVEEAGSGELNWTNSAARIGRFRISMAAFEGSSANFYLRPANWAPPGEGRQIKSVKAGGSLFTTSQFYAPTRPGSGWAALGNPFARSPGGGHQSGRRSGPARRGGRPGGGG